MHNKKLISEAPGKKSSVPDFENLIEKLTRTPALKLEGENVLCGISDDCMAVVMHDKKNCVLFYNHAGNPIGCYSFTKTADPYTVRVTEIIASSFGLSILTNANQVAIRTQGKTIAFNLELAETGIDVAIDRTHIYIVTNRAFYCYNIETQKSDVYLIPSDINARPKAIAVAKDLVFLSDMGGAISVFQMNSGQFEIKTVLQIFRPVAKELVMTLELGDELLTHAHAVTTKKDLEKTPLKSRYMKIETGRFEQLHLASSRRLQDQDRFVLDDQFKRIAHLDATPITKIMILDSKESGAVIAAQSTHSWQIWTLAANTEGAIETSSVKAKKESHAITASTSCGRLFIYATAENKVKIIDSETDQATAHQLPHAINQIVVSTGCLFCCDAGTGLMTVIAGKKLETFRQAANGIVATGDKLLLQTGRSLSLFDLASNA